MDESLQLLSFLVSFLYGMFFFLVTVFHFKVVQKYPVIFQYFSSFLFILDVVLIYLILFYHLNDGVFHIYFIFFVFLGFFVMHIVSKNVKFWQLLRSKIEKIFHR